MRHSSIEAIAQDQKSKIREGAGADRAVRDG
jgi:hypothetical protein